MDYTDLMGLSAAIAAAAKTGLLMQLIEGPPRTTAELATACKTDPRATALVLDVLVAFEVAVRINRWPSQVHQCQTIAPRCPRLDRFAIGSARQRRRDTR